MPWSLVLSGLALVVALIAFLRGHALATGIGAATARTLRADVDRRLLEMEQTTTDLRRRFAEISDEVAETMERAAAARARATAAESNARRRRDREPEPASIEDQKRALRQKFYGGNRG